MTRTMHQIMFGMLLAVAICAGGSVRASAQIAQACCNFKVVISNAMPTGCMPISVTTSWGGSAQTNAIGTKGSPITVPIGVACPPAPVFNWVSLDGGTTRFTGPGSAPCITLPCGTSVTVDVIVNPITGCIDIHVAPCV